MQFVEEVVIFSLPNTHPFPVLLAIQKLQWKMDTWKTTCPLPCLLEGGSSTKCCKGERPRTLGPRAVTGLKDKLRVDGTRNSEEPQEEDQHEMVNMFNLGLEVLFFAADLLSSGGVQHFERR